MYAKGYVAVLLVVTLLTAAGCATAHPASTAHHHGDKRLSQGKSTLGAGAPSAESTGAGSSTSGASSPPPTFGVRIALKAVVHGVPLPDQIEGMQFISNRTGFVAAQTMPWSALSGAPSSTPGGTLKATQDGGRTWRRYPLPPIVVTGIDFLTASHGFAYGKAAGRAALYQTEDGGRIWAPLISRPLNPSQPYQETLDDMHFWSSQSGDLLLDGHLYLTSDGGQTWRAASLPEGAEDTVFVGDEQGYAITAATIYETEDGARFWHAVYHLPSHLVQSSPPLKPPVMPYGLNALAGVPLNLLAAAGGGTVNALFAEGACGPYPHCASYLVQESAGRFAAPAQAAALWPLSASHVLLLRGLLAAGISLPANGRITIPGGTTAVSSPFPGSIWVTSGGGWNGSSVYHSTDGGLHWTEASPLRPNLGIQFVTVRDGYGFTTGASGLKLLATSNGGLHWKERSTIPAQLQIDGFGFGHSGMGYLFASVGSTASGEVLRTADGGRSWTVVSSDQQTAAWQRGLDVSVISRDVVVASDKDAVTVSRDGGKTWRQTASLPGYSATTHFSSTNDGWAAAGGDLYRTQDGGRHWRRMGSLNPDNQQPPPEVISFAFPGSQSALIGVASGGLTLLRSLDGGIHWTERAFPDNYAFGSYLADAQREFSVVSPSVAYLDNFSGLYRTTDGGKTWYRLSIH